MLSIASLVLAIFVVILSVRMHVGVEKFANPAGSIMYARLSGVLVRPGNLVEERRSADASHISLEETWIENIVERYESIPVYKTLSGRRICVKIQSSHPEMLKNLYLYEREGDVLRTRGIQRSVFGRHVVFVLDVGDNSQPSSCYELSLASLDGEEEVRFSGVFQVE